MQKCPDCQAASPYLPPSDISTLSTQNLVSILLPTFREYWADTHGVGGEVEHGAAEPGHAPHHGRHVARVPQVEGGGGAGAGGGLRAVRPAVARHDHLGTAHFQTYTYISLLFVKYQTNKSQSCCFWLTGQLCGWNVSAPYQWRICRSCWWPGSPGGWCWPWSSSGGWCWPWSLEAAFRCNSIARFRYLGILQEAYAILRECKVERFVKIEL